MLLLLLQCLAVLMVSRLPAGWQALKMQRFRLQRIESKSGRPTENCVAVQKAEFDGTHGVTSLECEHAYFSYCIIHINKCITHSQSQSYS